MSIAVISLLSISVIAFIIMIGYWVLSFERTGSKKYNFLRFFPFELNAYRRNGKDKYLNIGLIAISFITFIAPVIGFAVYKSYASSYIMMTVLILAAFTFLLLLFTKLSNYKAHLMITTFFVCFVLGLIILEFIYFTVPDTNNGYIEVSKSYMAYIVLAINIIQIIFEFVLILNPNYKSWAKMVKVDAEVFSRPKFNYLGCIEWGTFLNLIVCYIPIVLLSF